MGKGADFSAEGVIQHAGRPVSWRMSGARYAANQVALRTDSDSGFKTPVAWMAEALGARYSGRERAYILPVTKAKVLQKALEAGWTAKQRFFDEQDVLFFPPGADTSSDDNALPYNAMKKRLSAHAVDAALAEVQRLLS